MNEWQNIGNDKKIKTVLNGRVVVIAPTNTENIVPIFCSCCNFPMKTSEDSVSFRKYGVCEHCHNRWSNKPGVEWPTGPDKNSDDWKTYIETSLQDNIYYWNWVLGMVRDYKKLLRISQILNGSFGTGGPGRHVVSGFNVRLDPIDDRLVKARCIMNVSFRSDQMMRELLRKYRDESVEMIKAALDRAAKDYEVEFDEKIKFSFDEKALDESTEFYHVSQYTAQSRAFYRVTALVRVD
jgi:hypothetical protein